MEDITKRRTVRRRSVAHVDAEAGSTPIPVGPGTGGGDALCGHGGCEERCNVRYVGPTTSLSDHHAYHAARGAAHVWTAAVVVGVALVVTGMLAYTSVEAKTRNDQERTRNEMLTKTDFSRILNRLDRVEQALKEVQASR